MARSYKQLERIVRGFSNHRRIEILNLLDTKGPLDLTGICKALGILQGPGDQLQNRVRARAAAGGRGAGLQESAGRQRCAHARALGQKGAGLPAVV
jgi:hypothetical protein